MSDETKPLGFADPAAQARTLRAELIAAATRVIDGTSYILGPEVAAFEAEFAAWLGPGHAIGVANGTDAIELALRALDIGPGDEVLAPAHTAIPTHAAILRAGATPVMVDVRDDDLTLDPADVARKLTRRARAAIAVHLYGQPAALAHLEAVCLPAEVVVIEDCAQAHGATIDGAKVGTLAPLAAFSFYPTKNLGALGDGGLVAARDPEIAAKLRMLRQYGWREPQNSELPGVNSRLDELQAALLRVKLPHLDRWTARRRAIAAAYGDAFAGTDVRAPVVRAGTEHAWHLYVVRHAARDRLRAHLAEQGIGTGIHYPRAAHRHPAYARFADPDSLPVTERALPELLSLPIYPEMTDADVARVIAAVRAFA